MSKMLIDRSVVEQALEALTWCEPEGAVVTAARSAAINALRAALEQEEQEQEPVGNSYADLFNALQRIETAAVFLPSFKITHEGGLEAVVQNIVDAIAALEQEEQEPMSQPGITKLQAEVKALRGLINLKSAEWRDKNIYPCGGEAYQNWAVTVYLPVPLSVADKSPESALARAIEEEEKNT